MPELKLEIIQEGAERIVEILHEGPPGPKGDPGETLVLTGPALAGRASGTGNLVSIPLAPGLGIVNGALTLTGVGTVTSVGLSVPTGFSVANAPITSSGTLAISYAPGYSLPTIAKQGQWDLAYQDLGLARTPAAHKISHSIGGADALTPADIGAATAAQGAKADTAVQPAGLTKAAVGLGNVDDTSDANKPVSTAMAAALAGKLNTSDAFNPASPGDIGGITPRAGTFTALLATTRLGLPSGAPSTPAARDLYQVVDTLRYRDSGGNERLLLNATDNLANLSNAQTARGNLGAAASGPIGTSGLTMATARLLGRTTAGAGAVEEVQVSGGSFANGVLTLSGLPSTLTADDSGNVTFSARWVQTTNGAASAPPMALTGTWFTGGTSTTTKPQFLIEPAGTTSNNWGTAGTGLGVNAPPGFAGTLFDLRVNGSMFGRITVGTSNVFWGEGAGAAVSSYSSMVAIGRFACGGVTTAGTGMVAVGNGAFRYLNVANASIDATAVGSSAGGRILAAGASVLIGGYAGQGSANFSAQIQRTTCAGFEAGAGFNATTLADNSLFGYRAGFAISSGNQNTFIGSGAGSAVTTGSNNIAIGFNAAVDSITASNQINIGGVYYHDRIEGSKRFTGNVGFYNATPVAQPAAVANATDAASVITQLNLALARLRSLGLIAT